MIDDRARGEVERDQPCVSQRARHDPVLVGRHFVRQHRERQRLAIGRELRCRFGVVRGRDRIEGEGGHIHHVGVAAFIADHRRGRRAEAQLLAVGRPVRHTAHGIRPRRHLGGLPRGYIHHPDMIETEVVFVHLGVITTTKLGFLLARERIGGQDGNARAIGRPHIRRHPVADGGELT